MLILRPGRRRHLDATTGRRRVDGVREEIDQDLLEMSGIDEDRWQVARHHGGQLHSPAPGKVLEEGAKPVRDRLERGVDARGLSLMEGIQGGSDHPGDAIDLTRDDAEVLPKRRVRREHAEHELGPAGDDVQRRTDLVCNARRELAGDGERFRQPQSAQQLEGSVRLRLHPMARLLQPLGHPVERHRDLSELVAAPDRDRGVKVAGADALERLRQIDDGSEDEPLEREPHDETEQGHQNGRAQRTPVILAEKISLETAGPIGDLENSLVGAEGSDGQQHGVEPEPARPALHDR